MSESDTNEGFKHVLYMFNLRFVLIKSEKGYRGTFTLPSEEDTSYPILQGYNFKQALKRLVTRAFYSGLVSIEEMNNFIGLSWKTPIDIEFWTKSGSLVQKDGKHYLLPSAEEIKE